MVDNATPAPDELEEPEADLPETDQVEAEATPDDQADRPAAVAPSKEKDPTLAEFTRTRQAFAELKAELGLPRSATQKEVTAAIAALKDAQPAQPAELDDDAEEDPRVIEANERARAAMERATLAEMAAIRSSYGDDFADETFAFVNLSRTSTDLDAIVDAAANLVLKYRDRFEEPEGEETAETEEPEAVDIDLSDGAAPIAQRPTPGARRRDTGVVGAVRDIFAQAGSTRR